MKKLLPGFLACLLFIFGIFGCENEITPSVYDPNHPKGAQPIIDSISPAGSALAAAQPLTIYGKNFSTTAGENHIFFNGKPGTVLSATATQLIATSSADSGSVTVLVSTTAEQYSPGYPYNLILAVDPFGNFTPPATGAAALTPDSAGRIYFDLLASGSDNGVYVMDGTGAKTQFAAKTTGLTSWKSMKRGPGGYLYAVQGQRRLSRFTPTGVLEASYLVLSNAANILSDIDFDQNKNIWAGGNASFLNCIKPDKSTKAIPFTGAVRAVRVFDGYLYFSALKDSVEKVFRAVINNDTLGTIEEYFNITSAVGAGYSGQALTFSADGYLYIGTLGTIDLTPTGPLVVAPDKSFTTPYAEYSDLFATHISSMAWGTGDILYIATAQGNVLKVRTLKNGAPYYGVN